MTSVMSRNHLSRLAITSRSSPAYQTASVRDWWTHGVHGERRRADGMARQHNPRGFSRNGGTSQ
jgi:hypothetical protein